jgi:UDP-N-acetylmuramyl pentapeptide phosphotransferase/UDP-N-acetylglucosamine-1-phosphate transferase
MMEFDMLWFVAIFVLSFSFVAIVNPAIVKVANKINLFDGQDERKVHTGRIPRLGGIAFLPAILFTLFVVEALIVKISPTEVEVHYAPVVEMMLMGAGCLLLYLTGIMDDVIGLSYKNKFIVQILASLMVCASGLYITDFHGILGIHSLHPVLGVPLTILIIVFVINSINLIDGIDGLASGLCIFGSVGYAIMFHLLQMSLYFALAVSIIGILLMFYLYNTLGKPGKTKTFMGDTGSLTMGFMLAFFVIKLSCMTSLPAGGKINDDVLFIYAVSVIFVPAMDVFRVFFARIMDKKSPFYPDKRHIHHKFLALGFTMRKARWMIFSISAFFCLLNLALSFFMNVNINIVVLVDIFLWIIMNMYISSRVMKLKLENDAVAQSFVDVGKPKFRNVNKMFKDVQ